MAHQARRGVLERLRLRRLTLDTSRSGPSRAVSRSPRLEGVRRVGVATYLLSISLGLATIFSVVRFQTRRLTELPGEAPVGAI